MKTCSKCKLTKELDEFSIKNQAKDGLNYQCRSCCNKRTREYLKEKRTYQPTAIWDKLNPDKRRTHQKVHKAVKSGTLEKPECCEACDNTTNIVGHHEDYDKPLEVLWLCRRCHGMLHRSNERIKDGRLVYEPLFQNA